MRTQVHRDATAELEAAAEWYECEEEGLGEELLEEVARGLAVIVLDTGDTVDFSDAAQHAAEADGRARGLPPPRELVATWQLDAAAA